MGLTRIINSLLYGRKTQLRNYELFCVNNFMGSLSSEARSVLEAQLKSIDNIQRFSKDKLVVVHFWEDARRNLPIFPNRSSELYAARIVIRAKELSAEIRCDIVFHEGRLSSLEFNRSPKSLEGKECSLEKVEAYEDLLSQPAIEAAEPPQKELLNRLQTQFAVTDVLPPKPYAEIRKFLDRLSTKVPDDYTRLLHESDGFSIKSWRFYGTNARRIVHEHDNYWLLAEAEKDGLCFRENESEPVVVFYDQIDDEASVIGEGFVDALIFALSKN